MARLFKTWKISKTKDNGKTIISFIKSKTKLSCEIYFLSWGRADLNLTFDNKNTNESA